MELSDVIHEFTAFHDQMLAEWKSAMETGSTVRLEEGISESYYVTFFTGGELYPTRYDKTAAIAGMRQSVEVLKGAVKKFEHRLIRARDENNVVVFYEQVIQKENSELARLFTIESWRRNDDTWEIVRETVEHVGF